MARRKSYHHGNLRQVLLDSALALIRAAGPQALTLREVARRAGVSHNAPYRHFRHKDDLLAEIAAAGFDLLRASQEAGAPSSDPLARFLHGGREYVRFALRYPEHFAVMFQADLHNRGHARLAEAAGQTFQLLLDQIAACQAQGTVRGGETLDLALAAWSMVHGAATLGVSIYRSSDEAEVIAFADSACRLLYEGLRAGAQAAPGRKPG